MSHYIDIHLEDKSIDTIILHVGVKDLLNDNSQSNYISVKYFCVWFNVYYKDKLTHARKSS